MAEFRMPSLGSDMEKGTLVEWLKRPGDIIAPGDIVAVIETEKGAIEIESYQSGIFERALVDIGATVPVGTAIAIFGGTADASAPKLPARSAPRPKEAAPPKPALAPPAIDLSAGIKASPAARKLAAERGVDLAAIKGSGQDGSVVYIDVENFVATEHQSLIATKKPKSSIDLGAMRRIIAAATARSKREIPHYYLTHGVDITPTLAWLAQFNATRTPDLRMLPAAVLLKALASASCKHADFNGFYTKDGFQPSKGIHIGVAIALRGGGLVAPAIHDVDKLPLEELMRKLRDLVERVRAGRFRSSEISDATLTFTGLGERGVDSVIPVIYPPQVAIAGAGTPRERPWVVAGKIEPRQIITLSLAGDHRASDGHQGALFLAAWAEMLKAPERL